MVKLRNFDGFTVIFSIFAGITNTIIYLERTINLFLLKGLQSVVSVVFYLFFLYSTLKDSYIGIRGVDTKGPVRITSHRGSGRRNRSTSNGNGSKSRYNPELDPWFITGFTDGEGSFSIIIQITNIVKWKVRASFEINLHSKDLEILKKIQAFFGGIGNIYVRSDRPICVYRVTNVSDLLSVIIPHFSTYPLVSQKQADFKLWATVVDMMSRKEHLQFKGCLTILSYYASINLGVSAKVASFYPNIIAIARPPVVLPAELNGHWVSGFTAAEGGFHLVVRPMASYASGFKVDYGFRITQHIRDLAIMKQFITFFGCGTVYTRTDLPSPRCDFMLQDAPNLLNHIIPHFEKYPLHNIKTLDFDDFKTAMDLVRTKQHLTPDGLATIKDLAAKINTGRI